jgi:hypothetical protein
MKYIKKYEQRYLSDAQIEAQYDNFKIVGFSIERFYEDGGASGWIDIEFPEDEVVKRSGKVFCEDDFEDFIADKVKRR